MIVDLFFNCRCISSIHLLSLVILIFGFRHRLEAFHTYTALQNNLGVNPHCKLLYVWPCINTTAKTEIPDTIEGAFSWPLACRTDCYPDEKNE